jgi:hypothetical protein
VRDSVVHCQAWFHADRGEDMLAASVRNQRGRDFIQKAWNAFVNVADGRNEKKQHCGLGDDFRAQEIIALRA